jgi:hypothetical protein
MFDIEDTSCRSVKGGVLSDWHVIRVFSGASTSGSSCCAPQRTSNARTFLCDCSSAGCVEHIAITPVQYQHVRSNPAMFAVFPNATHVFEDVERIVDRHPGHWVIEKLTEAAAPA